MSKSFLFPTRELQAVELQQEMFDRMDLRGRSERIYSQYVRRSWTLRKQKSAYDSMREWVYEEYTKQGGTAGLFEPVPA